ncbi:P1 family peptidase [Sinomonas atrocyanea]|uniref:P1 family peptidase n=1 Tax=Sinomonas atrocyanea TaxID=37927 RepID=UPI00285AEBA1|nr:P1 family peptidase [Sinomonas atrocyanea]MDR6620940.1 L-aminopeptidase/D-esterase-like protein [Sinomonas atrocyanea]
MGSLLDVPGLRVGHAQRSEDGWLSGVTAVVLPPGSAGGVDVRGGGPGTIETDALDPSTLVQTVDGIALCGGSAYGLAAAGGVQLWLEQQGQGHPVVGGVVPIVAGAVIFDLGRGGDFGARPDAAMGFEAAAACVGLEDAPDGGLRGCVGAGTGAAVGRAMYKGGVGMASVRVPGGAVPGPPGGAPVVLPEGIVVGALAVVNAAGVPVFPGAAGAGDRGDTEGEAEIAQEAASAGEGGGARGPVAPDALNTTLVVVATNASLTPAECKRLATAAHAGLARALDPSHTLVDGDTVFGLSTRAVEFDRSSEAGRVVGLMSVQVAAANAVREAILDGVRSATPVTTPAGTWERFPVP